MPPLSRAAAGGPRPSCHRPARGSLPTAVTANLRSLPPNCTGIARHTKEKPLCSTFVQVIKGTKVSNQAFRLQVHRVRTSGRPQPSFASGVQRGRQGQTCVGG